jgi:Zn-dependent protease
LLQQINFAAIFIGFIVLLFSLSVHESAHAWMAWRLGDPTGRLMGRVSLNPAAHVDMVGTVLFPLLAMATRLPLLGWAKPVPVDILKLKNYRRDFMLIAAAGPMSNLLLAVVGAIAMRLVGLVPSDIGRVNVAGPIAQLSIMMVELNVLLAVFNMIPVPPLDGGTVLGGLLPERAARVLDGLRPYGFIVLYALIFAGVLVHVVRASDYLAYQLLAWPL